MEFTINKENTEKLKELVKVSQSVADMTILRNLYEMVVTQNNLKAVAYGNGNIVEFTIDISNFTHSENKGYFYIDILQFIQAIEKVFSASGSEEANVKVNGSKLTVSQGKSKITVNMFDYLDEEEYKEADAAFENKSTELFQSTSNDNILKVTSELMSFSDTVGKFITMMNRKNVSGFSVNGDTIYYSDQALSIIEKKLSYKASNKQLFISVDLFNFLSSLSKVGDYDVCYSDDESFIKLTVPDLRLSAILSQPTVVAEYPTDEEFAAIVAADDNKFEFTIDIPTLLSKVDTFDGVFPSAQWKWKTVDFTFDKNNPEVINLYHSSDTAEVDTDLPLISSSISSNEDTVSFKVTTLLMADYLSKFMDCSDGKVIMDVSPLDVSEEHGIGIKIRLFNDEGTQTMMITLCKIFEEEVY